jgi:hypothetical protein
MPSRAKRLVEVAGQLVHDLVVWKQAERVLVERDQDTLTVDSDPVA